MTGNLITQKLIAFLLVNITNYKTTSGAINSCLQFLQWVAIFSMLTTCTITSFYQMFNR